MKKRVVYTLSAVLMAFSVSGASGKPIALVGAHYGGIEVTAITRAIITATAERQYRYEALGENLPPGDKLDDYSLIIVAGGVAEPLTLDEGAALERYVAEGGKLLLIAGAGSQPFRLLAEEEADTSWSGIRSSGWRRNGVDCSVVVTNSPWLKGVIVPERPEPSWLKARFIAVPTEGGMQPIVGSADGGSLVGQHVHGKGWVAFLGHEVFRMEHKEPDERSDRDGWLRLMANIIDSAEPLLESEWSRRLFDSFDGNDDLLLWSREWQAGERYGPRFDPPLPGAGEYVTALRADMALDEYEMLQLNVTPLRQLGTARFSFTAATFPAANVELLVQDAPDPIPWPKDPTLAVEAPYWPLPLTAVEPCGELAFTTSARETRILWVKVSSFGLKPGSHAGELKLDFAEGVSVKVPLEINLYPVRLPRQRLIKLTPSGTVYGDARDAKPALRFMRNLRDNGYEWSMLSAIRPSDATIRGEGDDSLTPARLTEIHADVMAGKGPKLNFSIFDEWIEASFEHYQTRFKMGSISANLVAVMKRHTKIPSEDYAEIEEWFNREVARYLREKGARVMICGMGDELSEKEILERYIPWAKKMAAAGWGTSSTFTGMKHVEPGLNRQLVPYVQLWTLNRGLALPFVEALQKNVVAMRPGAILGTYGAGEGRGTEIRKRPSQSRFLGWESWHLGVVNCSPNPYFKGWLYYIDYGKDRGIAGERLIAYLDKDDPDAPMINSPFMEGIREGLEDGNLAAILGWYLEHLPRSQTKHEVRERLGRLLAPEETALLPYTIRTQQSGLTTIQIQADSDGYRRAKREVLELLTLLRSEVLRSIKPSLYWHDTPLIEKGKVRCAIYGRESDVAGLAAEIYKLSGMELPLISDATNLNKRYPVAIVVGNGSENPLTAALLDAAGEADASEAYPGAGGYFIKELPAGKEGATLVIAGPDGAGTAKGVHLFGRFLRAEGAWLEL